MGSGRVEPNIVSSPSFSLCRSHTSLLLLAAPEAAVSRAGLLPAPQRAARGAGVGWPALGSARHAPVGFAPWHVRVWSWEAGGGGQLCGMVAAGRFLPSEGMLLLMGYGWGLFGVKSNAGVSCRGPAGDFSSRDRHHLLVVACSIPP